MERRHLCRRAMTIYGLSCIRAGQAAVFLCPTEQMTHSPCELGTTVIFVDIWLWFLSDKQQIAVLLYDVLLLQQVGEGSVLFFFG